MSAKLKPATLKSELDEAAYQLAVNVEFTGWMIALMKAIQLDRKHEDGRGVETLADLGVYLADARYAGAEQACERADGVLLAMEGGAK